MKSMNIGTSGMSANETALATIANNIANSQTTGYKTQETKFEELFYQQVKSPSSANEKYAGTNPMDVGNGVKVSTVATDFAQGSITSTGKKNDLAIQGEGFFITGDSKGDSNVYTRNGNFEKSENNELITQSGQYVLGWNIDELSGEINTTAGIEPIQIPIGSISDPKESTSMSIQGNLNISSEDGEVYGLQVSSWDRLGEEHPIDLNFVKTGPNTFRYAAVPTDQFTPSASISDAVLHMSEGIASSLQKGNYTISTAAAGGGNVTITVTNPSGGTILSKTVSDTDQTVALDDGTNKWFTIDLKAGGAPSSSSFTVGEVGDVSFNSIGQLQSVSGSGVGGNPMITYTPLSTGQPVNINVDLKTLTALSADSGIKLTNTDGAPAAMLTDYTISDGGGIDGYYSDGSIKPIGQLAIATFTNPGGLTRIGQGNFIPTANSGVPDVGAPGTGSRGDLKAQALEASNVDLSKQFVDMLTVQKSFQANTKVIKTSDDVLTDVINLIR
jgi:flagellar hook protein FlgE